MITNNKNELSQPPPQRSRYFVLLLGIPKSYLWVSGSQMMQYVPAIQMALFLQALVKGGCCAQGGSRSPKTHNQGLNQLVLRILRPPHLAMESWGERKKRSVSLQGVMNLSFTQINDLPPPPPCALPAVTTTTVPLQSNSVESFQGKVQIFCRHGFQKEHIFKDFFTSHLLFRLKGGNVIIALQHYFIGKKSWKKSRDFGRI